MAAPSVRAFRSASGFSLPEVIVALGILSTALASLAGLLAVSIRADLSSRERTYAAVLAQQKLEELRPLVSASDYDGRAMVGTDHVDRTGRVVARAAAAFARQWSIQALAAHPATAVSLLVVVEPLAAAGRPVERCRLVTVVHRTVP